MPILIVKWKPDQDCSKKPPASATWGDGRIATHADYFRHCSDTHELTETESGLECRIYPGIIGHVRYDAFACQSFVTGEGIETTSLDLADPGATDCAITAALYALPLIYKCHIHRGNLSSIFPAI